MKRLFFIIFFFVIFKPSISQNNINIRDTFEIKISNLDTTAFTDAIYLINKYKYINPDSSLYYCDYAILISKNLNLENKQAYFLMQKAEIFRLKKEYYNAIYYYLEALNYLKEDPRNNLYVQTVINSAKSMKEGEFQNSEVAINYLNQLIELSKSQKYYENISEIYSLLAMLYIDNEPPNDSISNFINQAIEYAPYCPNNDKKASVFYNIAKFYEFHNDYLKSITYIKKSINIVENEKDKGTYLFFLANLYININQLLAASNFLTEAEKIFIKNNDNVSLTELYLTSSQLYLKEKKIDDAIKYAQRCLRLAKYTNIYFYQQKAYETLAEIYSQINQIDLALYSYKKYSETRDMIFFNRTKISTDLMFKNYIMQLKLKDRQLLLKQKEYQEYKNSQQKLVIIILGFSGVLLLATLFALFRMYYLKKISESRLLKFAQASQEGIIIHDGKKIIDVNDKYCQISQFERKELIEKNVLSIMPESSQKQVKLRSSIEHTVFYKMPLLRKDCSTFEAEILSKPFFVKNKKVKVVSIRDLSELKDIKEKLFETQERFKTLIVTSPDGIVFLNTEGEIKYVSPAFISIFKYNDETELIGKNIQNLFIDEYKNKIKQDLKNIVNGTFKGICDYTAITSEGKKFYIEINGNLIRKEDGSIDSIFWVVRDITSKKLVENALIESESRFRGLFNNSNDAIILQNKDYNIIDVNPAASKLLGYTYQEILTFDFRELLDVNQQKIDYNRFIEQQIPLETYFYTKHRKRIFIQVLFSTLPFNNLVYYQLTIRDLTDLKRQEEKLLAAIQKLTASNSTKDKLFSIIAHDLRGPIGTWRNMIEFISSNPEDFKADELVEFIKTLQESSSKTYDLLDNLLNWAKSQQNVIGYNPSVFNISDLIKQVVDNIIPIAKNKKIEIVKQTQDVDVLADENMIKIVIRNLLSNAIKFSNENSQIIIKTEEREKDILIKIQDFGIGISDENLLKIKDEQNYFTTYGTKNEKGTGLGLKICMDFVKKNQGTLQISSEINKSSIFAFNLKKKI